MRTDPQHPIQSITNGGHDLTPDQDLAAVLLGPSVTDVDIDGLDIDAAAQCLGVGQDDVWRRIRNGQLMARTEWGKVFVYSSVVPDTTALPRSEESLPHALPPTVHLPDKLSHLQETVRASSETALTVSHQDMALLIDHMNLTKEENREILRLTRDSMARLSEMTDKMLAMKNDVIAARESQVEVLSEQLDRQSDELRKLQRDKENLETLTRVLSTHADL